MKILVTGAAGFIGSALCLRLVKDGHKVLGIDNLNDYYDVLLKMKRNERLLSSPSHYEFRPMDIQDEMFGTVVEDFSPDVIVNLAAQAGVRYSLENPAAYLKSNVDGFFNVLEACRIHNIKKLVYASSSSVYGDTKVPFHETDRVDDPVSFYAATKICNEIFAKSYKNIFGLNSVGLRFFTVYGPWGRPDMAVFKFTKKILEGSEIELYNSGKNLRDFTYIDDIIEGVVRTIMSDCDKDIYNIGNNKPIEVLEFVEMLESVIGKKAIKKLVPQAKGDVFQTYASTKFLEEDFGYQTTTDLYDGLRSFFKWYNDYEQK